MAAEVGEQLKPVVTLGANHEEANWFASQWVVGINQLRLGSKRSGIELGLQQALWNKGNCYWVGTVSLKVWRQL
jgi:hypothetical protein